jgi:hypothetical protein
MNIKWIDDAIEKAMGRNENDPISLLKIAGMSALNLWKFEQIFRQKKV